jgi:hypothetical protein
MQIGAREYMEFRRTYKGGTVLPGSHVGVAGTAVGASTLVPGAGGEEAGAGGAAAAHAAAAPRRQIRVLL